MNLTFNAYDLKHCGKMMMALNKQRESKEHCDFAIMVGDRKIPAHRNVLSAGSDYFRAMLSHENIESRNGIVAMQQVQYSSVKTCIEYIYTGNLLTHYGEDCEQLLYTASMMQIKGLCDKIAISLLKKLSPGSFYSTKMIANTFNCVGLVESCNKYALRNFQSIAAEENFKRLDEDFVSFLLGSKEINTTEAVKCKALVIWTNHDVETRTSTFLKLFEKLDLAKISKKYQKFLVEKEPLVFDSARYHAALMNIPTDGSRIVAEDIDIKNAAKPINAIAVFDIKSRSIHAFHPKTKTWTKLQKISADFVDENFTAVVLGNTIYVLVFDGTNYQLNYTETNATWIRLADRRITKKRLAAVAFEGLIYAFDDSGNNSKAVGKFVPSDGTWSHVTEKPLEGWFTSVVAAGCFIYCFGGYNHGYLSNAMKFNPSDSKWTTLPSMTYARNRAAVVELDGKIYVMSGYANICHNILECFDMASET
uniref:kelch-like protein 12 isoform X1 n=1 Tax=Styela clava TaxID=7725 RepID=UPI0019398C6E|nr:kelch-like protein 12 isoform X1 [Styela clava]